MRREDLPVLTERLGQLAEAFDRRAPTAGAMLVWLNVLKEFHSSKSSRCWSTCQSA